MHGRIYSTSHQSNFSDWNKNGHKDHLHWHMIIVQACIHSSNR